MKVLKLQRQEPRPMSSGLATVLCYDPYYARMLHSVRRCLADGYPIMVRLHPAAAYPASPEFSSLNDLEGHAVLLVGFDEDQRMVAVADPWNNMWGGRNGGVRWIKYTELSMTIVDQTRDCYIVATPFRVWPEIVGEYLEMRIGFYESPGIVMDYESLVVEEVRVSVGSAASVSLAGRWRVDESIHLHLPLSSIDIQDGAVTIVVEARVSGQRPYVFTDEIRTTYHRQIARPMSAQCASSAG